VPSVAKNSSHSKIHVNQGLNFSSTSDQRLKTIEYFRLAAPLKLAIPQTPSFVNPFPSLLFFDEIRDTSNQRLNTIDYSCRLNFRVRLHFFYAILAELKFVVKARFFEQIFSRTNCRQNLRKSALILHNQRLKNLVNPVILSEIFVLISGSDFSLIFTLRLGDLAGNNPV